MLDFATIDFETANHNRSSICSLGIVIVENGEIVEKIYRLIRPRPNFYCSWATDVHGLSYYDTCDEPEFPDIWNEIKDKLNGFSLMAHNSSFDESCLKAVHDLYEIQYPDYQSYCTYRTAKRKFPYLENHQLHTVSAHVGFNLKDHHHALADAEACGGDSEKNVL